MIRTLAIGLAILALLAVACGGGKSSTDKTATAVASPKTVKVQVDGTGTDHNDMFFQYFPDAVTLHPGDTIDFNLHDSGEPHTVSFGTFNDAMYKFFADNCPQGLDAPPCNSDNPPPELEAQFNEINSTFPSLLGEGTDANQGPANPCFLDTGDFPLDTPCPTAAQPDFNGTQSVYSSGWLGGDKDFTVKLADDIQPGTYKWICLLHGPEMIGTLTVAAKSAPADDAATVQKNRDDQLAKLVSDLKPAADSLTAATADAAAIGASAPGVSGSINEFAPATITIPVGGSVTWNSDGGHTISFNAPEDAKTIRTVASDGTVHVNQKAAAAAGLPPEPQAPDENSPPPPWDGGTWDGSGFLSTGFINAPQFKLTFATAGTYQYKCLVHDKMEGTIKVGS